VGHHKIGSNGAGLYTCECGCGVAVPFHKLRILEIKAAKDETLRETFVARRFYVRRECYVPFINELQAARLLEGLVISYIHHKTPWYRKLWHVRRVVKLQFVIHSRNKGIKATRRQSIRSGILFVVPNGLGKYLDRYWRWQNNRRYRKLHRAESGSPAQIPKPAAPGSIPGQPVVPRVVKDSS
jgi:hypothetical protein